MLSKFSIYAMLPVKDLKAAKKFYKETLELKEDDSDDSGGIFYHSGDTKVFVYESKFAGTNKGTAATWTVDDVDKTAAWLADKGIKFEHYDWPGVTKEGDVHVMGELRAAWFKDPSGNILGLTN